MYLFHKRDNQVLLNGVHPALLSESGGSAPRQDAGLAAWSTSTMWLDRGEVEREVGGRSKAGQSRSVYLLFSSALTARDRLALLNWALSTHTAALKLPDG